MDVMYFTMEPNASVECYVGRHNVLVTIEGRRSWNTSPELLLLSMTHQQAIAAGVVSRETVDAEIAKLQGEKRE
jgi:hypothetical protein